MNRQRQRPDDPNGLEVRRPTGLRTPENLVSDGRHPALRVVRDRDVPSRRDAPPANDPVLQRAGLRRPPAPGEPTAAFVVVEMAILVVVAALAMASIIVTSGCSDGDGHSVATTTRTRIV